MDYIIKLQLSNPKRINAVLAAKGQYRILMIFKLLNVINIILIIFLYIGNKPYFFHFF